MGTKDAVHNIIFDLGGVFLDIDFSKTVQLMTSLVGVEIYNRNHQYEFIDQFEMGQISSEEFYLEVNALAKASGQKHDLNSMLIDQAWNAMLLGMPEVRMEWLRKVSAKKRVFLLSNTNAIHKLAFDYIATKTLGSIKVFDEQFEGAYYSHLIGLRKPNPDAFKYIIDRHGLDPHHTLFIDDTASNLIGAEAAGLKVFHLTAEITSLTF